MRRQVEQGLLMTLFIILALGSPVAAINAETSADRTASVMPPYAMYCADLYPNFAVNVSMMTPVDDLVSGTTMDVTTELRNKTEYPITNATVYAQVYRLNGPDGDVSNAMLVDQFAALSDVALEPMEEFTASFEWDVPVWLPSGSYVISTAVLANDTQQLSGSALWARAPGNTMDFTVTNDDPDRTIPYTVVNEAVAVNGQVLAQSPELPLLDRGDVARITIPVANQRSTEQSLRVEWTLYKYNQTTQEHVLVSDQERVVLSGADDGVITKSYEAGEHGVYVAVAKITNPLGEQSYVNVPFAVGNVFDPYIDFVALEEGEAAPIPYLYVCLDRFGGGVTPENVALSVTLETSQRSESLLENESITLEGEPYLQVLPIPDTRFARATATVSIASGGAVLHQQTYPVLCRGGSCLGGDAENSSDTGGAVNNLFYLIGASLLAVILLVLVFSAPLLRRMFKGSNS